LAASPRRWYTEEMENHRLGDLEIVIEKWGSRDYAKVSYPLRYGCFSEIISPEVIYQFGLNGELKFLQGRGPNWPHPAEWLKRSAGGDWVYYSAGEYREIFDLFGEYYVPRLSYRSNCIFRNDPFQNDLVTATLQAWGSLCERLRQLLPDVPTGKLRDFVERVCENDPGELLNRAERLHALLGGRVTVLPPDARHVDYDVIPVVVADGCLYHCAFCGVKSARPFQLRSPENVQAQIEGLREFFARDLSNYNSIFLAHHDALAAGSEAIEFAASRAYETLEMNASHMRGARLFLFGSADSLLSSRENVFGMIQNLPFHTHINVGLESADPETLAAIGKPITAQRVEEAFERMLEINRDYPNIEMSANFVCGGRLPPGHLPSLVSLTREKLDRYWEKGALYLSPLLDGVPLQGNEKRKLVRDFREVKMRARMPTYLYLIQRL
jgi:hypothetical protein